MPSLKNDGRGELRFREVVNDFSPKKNRTGNASRFCMFYIKGKRAKCKPSPLVGEGGGEAVGRGKCEQI